MFCSSRIVDSISLHKASKLTEEPGNFSLAKLKVSTISLDNFLFPLKKVHYLSELYQNQYCIISLLSFIKSKSSDTISLNFLF